MREKAISVLDKSIYWLIILLPFSIAIAIAPMEVFMGLLMGLFLIKKILKKENPFVRTTVNLPLLFLFLITCVSLVNSIDLQDTFKGGIFKLLRYILLFFILIQETKDIKHVTRIVGSVICGLVLTSVDGIWQVLTGKDFIRGYEPILNIELLRATASFKDANVFGIYLSAFAPVVFGLTLYPVRKLGKYKAGVFSNGVYYSGIKKKLTMLSISLLVLAAVALAYSRPTLLAVYIALLFLGAVKKNKVLLSILIALIFVSPFILPESFKKWARSVEYNPIRVMCNDDRIAIFVYSINMIKAHPVIGVGANTFMKNYKDYKNTPAYRNAITSDYVYAHNNFLHLAAELGLIGLGVFLWLLYKMFRGYRNIYKKLSQDYSKLIFLSLMICLISFMINGLCESSLYYSRVAAIFWYLAGLAFAFEKFTSLKKETL